MQPFKIAALTYSEAVLMTTSFEMTPVAIVEGCYPDKFGVPRQPGLAPSATARLVLQAPFDTPDALRGLETFSHIWLTFVFHRNPTDWHALVRPPRLGGNRKVGVFASRATHRPNRLGLSLVEIVDIELTAHPCLIIRGHDLVDGTPILDIKPYLPWSDSAENAQAGFAPHAPQQYAVHYSSEAQHTLAHLSDSKTLAALITEVVAQDPRPAYHQGNTQRTYGVRLRDIDVKFREMPIEEGQCSFLIVSIELVKAQ